MRRSKSKEGEIDAGSTWRSECNFNICVSSGQVRLAFVVLRSHQTSFDWQRHFGTKEATQAVCAVTCTLLMSFLFVWEQVSTLFGKKTIKSQTLKLMLSSFPGLLLFNIRLILPQISVNKIKVRKQHTAGPFLVLLKKFSRQLKRKILAT